jgi:DNA polymerase III subunit gamma/tau
MISENNRTFGGLWDADATTTYDDPPLDAPRLWEEPVSAPPPAPVATAAPTPAPKTKNVIAPAKQSQTLYRKWRSQTFNELVGQDHITQTLRNAIVSGRIGHAYLFCGPRGTGKTSTGRLLAKAVTCLEPDPSQRPCDKCEACRSIAEGRALDLIEIDAASNRGIDEVRELRDKINFQPSALRKKVYIIDEVHMMTEAAFNALLKTLEEPPPHALFVLATTDPQDIPATVVSRCQRFDFQRIPHEQTVQRLRLICQEENVQAEQTALELIARQSTGSLRDALSLLDQLIVYSGGNITAPAVRQMLGVMNSDAVANFVEALIQADMSAGLEHINKLVQTSADLKRFNRELVDYLRHMMLVKVNPNTRELVSLTDESQARLRDQAGRTDLPAIVAFVKTFSGVDYNLRVSPYGQLPLEIALMEALLQPSQYSAAPVPASRPPEPARNVPPRANPVAAPPPPVAEVAPAPAPAKTVAPNPAEVAPEPKAEPKIVVETETTVAVITTEEAAPPMENAQPLELPYIIDAWKRTYEIVKNRSKVNAAILDHANPTGIRGNRVVLTVAYEFHFNKIRQDEMRHMLEDHLSRFLGQTVLLECVDGSKNGGEDEDSAPKPTNERARKAANLFNARMVD